MMDAAKMTELEQRLQRLESLLSKTDTTVRDQVASTQAKAPTVLPTTVHTDRVQEAAWMIRVRATGFAIGRDDDGKVQIQVTPVWEIYSPVALIGDKEVVAEGCTQNQWNDITSTIGDTPGGKSLYGVVIHGDDGITGVQLVMSEAAPQTQHVTIATFNATGVSAYAQAHTGVLVLTAPGSSGGACDCQPPVYAWSVANRAARIPVMEEVTDPETGEVTEQQKRDDNNELVFTDGFAWSVFSPAWHDGTLVRFPEGGQFGEWLAIDTPSGVLSAVIKFTREFNSDEEEQAKIPWQYDSFKLVPGFSAADYEDREPGTGGDGVKYHIVQIGQWNDNVTEFEQWHVGAIEDALSVVVGGASGGTGADGAPGDTYVPSVYEGSTEDAAKMKAVHVKFTAGSGDEKDFPSINIRGAVFVPDRVVKGDRYGDLDPDTYYLYFKNSQTGAELGPIAIGKLDGADGAPGKDGADGEDGADGKDAELPAEKELTVITNVAYNLSSHKFTLTKRTIKGYFTDTGTDATEDVFEAIAHSEVISNG